MKTRLLLLIYILSSLTSISYSQERDNKKEILFLCSYSTDNDFSRSNISAFVDTYTLLNSDYKYSTEALSCTSLDDRGRWVNDTRKIMTKHKNASLVVLIGTEAIISYFSLNDTQIKKIPVFATMGQRFCAAMDDDMIPILSSKGHHAGLIDLLDNIKDFNVQLFYYYDYEINRDLQLITQLFPNTKEIAVISDNTINGISHLRQVKKQIRLYNKELRIEFIDGRYRNIDSAAKMYQELQQDAVTILCGWKYDKDGIAFMDNSRFTFMKANPNIPAFSLTGTGVGNWTIGGYIPLYRPLGEELAQRAYELLETSEWKGPYINGYSHVLKLDMNQLKKWNLMDKKLPSDVLYVNPEFNLKDYVQLYKWYFILGAGIFFIITISLIAAVISNIHIRRLKRNLEKKDALLEKEKSELISYQNELIVARDKADESSRLQSAFLSNMSHEIRTPLNAIAGFSEVLISTVDSTKEQQEYIHIIQHNTQLLLKLINDILDLSRIEAKKKKFFFEKTEIIALLNDVVLSMRPKAKKDVDIIFTHKEEKIVITTDTLRLQQIVMNLIGNAIKFTDKGSVVLNVKSLPEKEMVEFSITDTGCGISDENKERVFERFNKINEFAQGTGLGLAICKVTIDQFGGNIWIDKEYAQGTRFIFTIPTNHKASNDEE